MMLTARFVASAGAVPSLRGIGAAGLSRFIGDLDIGERGARLGINLFNQQEDEHAPDSEHRGTDAECQRVAAGLGGCWKHPNLDPAARVPERECDQGGQAEGRADLLHGGLHPRAQA